MLLVVVVVAFVFFVVVVIIVVVVVGVGAAAAAPAAAPAPAPAAALVVGTCCWHFLLFFLHALSAAAAATRAGCHSTVPSKHGAGFCGRFLERGGTLAIAQVDGGGDMATWGPAIKQVSHYISCSFRRM